MSGMSKRLRQQLTNANEQGRLVQIVRHKEWDRLDGCILGVGNRWILLAVESDAGFHGHSAIRISDIKKVKGMKSTRFTVDALRSEGHWPMPDLPGVDLTSTRTLVETVTTAGPLFAVFDEHDCSDACLVGTPTHFRPRNFTFLEITPRATWAGKTTTIKYRRISRIDVTDPYLTRLSRIGGAPPTTWHACPCCGYRTLPSRVMYELCPICYWEDDPNQADQPTSDDGANGASLIDAQQTFLRIGAMHEDYLSDTRPPMPIEARDPDWEPFGQTHPTP